MVTESPTVDISRLIVCKYKIDRDQKLVVPDYFLLVPDEFVERTQVVLQTLKIHDTVSGIKPIKVEGENELLIALDLFLRRFKHAMKNEELQFGLFPAIYADIFERSGLRLPIFYEKFSEVFRMEILYVLTSNVFYSWAREIHRFWDTIIRKTTCSKTLSRPEYATKSTILQKSLAHCELLSKTIVNLYETTEYTLWRTEAPEDDNPSNAGDNLYFTARQFKIESGFPYPAVSWNLLYQSVTVSKAWAITRLGTECREFFPLWIEYCRQPLENQFLTIPIFAVTHPWLFLDEIEKEVSKALHDYKQEELDKFYIPMLAHPVVVQLFEKSQHLEAFKNSTLMQYLLTRIETLERHVTVLPSRVTDKDGNVWERFYPRNNINKFGREFDVQKYRRYFNQFSNSTTSLDDLEESDAHITEDENKLLAKDFINNKIMHVLTKTAPFLTNDQQQARAGGLTHEDICRIASCNYSNLLLFEQVLNYLELHEISIIIKSLEKNIKRAEESGGFSQQQADQNQIALKRTHELIEKRKREEIECTAIFRSNPAERKYRQHRTSAIFYAFLYFLQKQLILEKNSVLIRINTEIMGEYLDRNSNIAKILSYAKNVENIFVRRLSVYIKLIPVDIRDQVEDIFRLSLPEYFIKWTAKKSFVGHFDISKVHKLNKQMDRGGQADVYLCRTDKFFYPVVFKSFIRTSARREVYSELDSLMLLQAHPHIVRLFGYVVEKGIPMGILMEYCEGGSLNNVINEENYRFEEDKTVHWMAQAASGLTFLHANDIIHTDLKSPNMLLSSDHRLLKISDMGFCKDVSLTFEKVAIYTSLKGTQGYIAPEIENQEPYRVASDMFSFGRTLWTLIFKDLTPDGLKFAITVHCPLKERNSSLFKQEEFDKLTAYITKKETIWNQYNKIKADIPSLPEKMVSLLLRLTMTDSYRRPRSEEIYVELTDYYKELLRTMDADRKAMLGFYPETRK